MLLSLSLLAQWPIRNHITKAINSQLKIYVTTFPVNTLYAEIIDCLALTHILKSQYMDKYLPINLKKERCSTPPNIFVFIILSLSLSTIPMPPLWHYQPPPPLNITALILPLHVQIFESAVKSLITPINLPDITLQLKAFGQLHWFFAIFLDAFLPHGNIKSKLFFKYFVNILFIQARRDKEGLSHKAVEIGFLSQNNN